MSLRDCIFNAVAGGALDGGRGQRAADLFDELEAEYRASAGPEEAQRLAAEETRRIMGAELGEKKRRELLQVAATRRIAANLGQYRTLRGEADPGAAMLAHLDRDELATFSNVEARRKSILGRLHGRMDEVLNSFRRDLLGRTRNKARLANAVREAFGEETGDAAARELARAWGASAEEARLRFNAAGGRIPKREDWGMPQIHDPLAVRKVPYAEWRDFTLERLDPARMIDEATGRPFTPERLELALRDVYETIASDGFFKMKPGGQARGRAIASRHTDHRFLVFRDANAWMNYQGRFGSTDAFNTMMGHLDGMAREIAALEILGPNPHATLRWMMETVEKDAGMRDAAAGGDKLSDRARGQAKTAADMFGAYTGSVNAPINGRFARGFAGLRSFLQSAQLGAAAISSITDFGFQNIAARHAGIPAAKVARRAVSLLNPLNLEDQKLAVRLGLIAENWSAHAIALARYTGEVSGPEISRRLADFTLRASLLSPWTQAGRWAFGMEFMGHLADQAGRAFDALPSPTRNTLARYGIHAADWDAMRAGELYTHEGASFLRPDDIAARADLLPGRAEDLATRMLEMIQTETEFAVPSSSLRGRAAFISDSRPGTFIGEVMRSVAMYKNFAITLASTHIRRAAMQPSLAKKGKYAAELMISTTVMGALALQLKEASKGRDPRAMEGPEFWGAAMMQGGGLGIFGDFLFSDVNRFGGGLPVTLAGPVVGFADDVRRLTIGNAMQAATGDNTGTGREMTRFLRRYTPGGSIWYARLAYERLVLDRLQELTDPRAAQSWRATEQRARREHGQGYWWAPGEALPDRAPDLTNATGG